MAKADRPIDLASLVGPCSGGEVLEAVARHPQLTYESGLPREESATFDVRTRHNPDQQLYVLSYARQPDGRWVLLYGAWGLEEHGLA